MVLATLDTLTEGGSPSLTLCVQVPHRDVD